MQIPVILFRGAKMTGDILNPSGSFKTNLDGITEESDEASYS